MNTTAVTQMKGNDTTTDTDSMDVGLSQMLSDVDDYDDYKQTVMTTQDYVKDLPQNDVCNQLNKLKLKSKKGNNINTEWSVYDVKDEYDILDRFALEYPKKTDNVVLVWTHVDTHCNDEKAFDASHAICEIENIIKNTKIHFVWYGEGTYDAIMVYVPLQKISEIGYEKYMRILNSSSDIVSFQNDNTYTTQGYTLHKNKLLYFDIDIDMGTVFISRVKSQSHVWNTFQEWEDLINCDYGKYEKLSDENRYMLDCRLGHGTDRVTNMFMQMKSLYD